MSSQCRQARYSVAMTTEAVELVKRIYDAWDRKESARDFISPEVEYVNPSYAVEPGVRRGRASFRVVRETYEDFKLAIERFVDARGRRDRRARRRLISLRVA